MAESKQSVSDAERTREELRARPLGQQPRESECTAEAARYFHDEGWNAAIAALARQEEGREAIETNYGSASGGAGDGRASGSTPQAQGYANGFDSRRSHPTPQAAPASPPVSSEPKIAEQLEVSDGPDYPDGCLREGFAGGCERMGCHKERDAFMVSLCGATDCFASGVFFDADSAKEWAEKESKNPEGYIIVPCKIAVRYGLMDEYGDIE